MQQGRIDEPSASQPQDVRTTLMNGTSGVAVNATLNTVIVATCNKGGSGKSTTARALVDSIDLSPALERRSDRRAAGSRNHAGAASGRRVAHQACR